MNKKNETIEVPKGTLFQQVKSLLKTHPELRPKEIAALLSKPTGTINTYISQIKRQEKEKAEEDRRTKDNTVRSEVKKQDMDRYSRVPGNTLVQKIEYVRKGNPHLSIVQIANELGVDVDSIKYYVRSIKEPANEAESAAKELVEHTPQKKEDESNVTQKTTLKDRIRSILQAYPDASVSYLADELGVQAHLIKKFYPEEYTLQDSIENAVEQIIDNHKPTLTIDKHKPTLTERIKAALDLSEEPITIEQLANMFTTDVEKIMEHYPEGYTKVSEEELAKATTEITSTTTDAVPYVKTPVIEFVNEDEMEVSDLSSESDGAAIGGNIHSTKIPLVTNASDLKGHITSSSLTSGISGENQNKIGTSDSAPSPKTPDTKSLVTMNLEGYNKFAITKALDSIMALLKNGESYDVLIDIKKKEGQQL